MSSNIISIGKYSIKWYSVILLFSFSIGYFLVMNKCKKKKYSLDLISNFCFYLVITCIIGARLYYCLFEFDYYSKHIIEIFEIWNGGLAIHGGVISGIIFLIYFTKKNKLDFLNLLDIFAPSLVLGQTIGRWGNFFNQEAYGKATTEIFLKKIHIPRFIIDGMNINGIYYHPTFFYESISCFIIFIIITIIYKRSNKKGIVSGIYFILYGLVRFFIESLRTDSLYFFNFKIAQIVSIMFICLGLILLFNSRGECKKNV